MHRLIRKPQERWLICVSRDNALFYFAVTHERPTQLPEQTHFRGCYGGVGRRMQFIPRVGHAYRLIIGQGDKMWYAKGKGLYYVVTGCWYGFNWPDYYPSNGKYLPTGLTRRLPSLKVGEYVPFKISPRGKRL